MMGRPKKIKLRVKETILLDERCPHCYILTRDHPRCNACGILCGIGHNNALCEYRGKKLCGYCVKRWQKLDELIGRQTTFAEMMNPEKYLKLFISWIWGEL